MVTLDTGPKWDGLTREFVTLAGIVSEQRQRTVWALLNRCCVVVSLPCLGVLNATVMVRDSPS
jgi:hypothetical protein